MRWIEWDCINQELLQVEMIRPDASNEAFSELVGAVIIVMSSVATVAGECKRRFLRPQRFMQQGAHRMQIDQRNIHFRCHPAHGG